MRTLARESGVNAKQIAKYERGERAPYLDDMLQLTPCYKPPVRIAFVMKTFSGLLDAYEEAERRQKAEQP